MNSQRNMALILLIGGLGLVSLWSASFVIPEGRQAIVTQFGRPVRTVTEAGLHWKTPFIQDVRMIDLRILNWDGYPNQIPTKDKKYIHVDTTARWKITNPLKFIQTVQNESGARSRLDAILDATTRDVISSHNLVEAVRNSNTILDRIQIIKEETAAALQPKTKDPQDKDSLSDDVVQAAITEEITGEVEKINIGREQLSQMIVEGAREEIKPLGIELIDVQIRRIAYEESVEKKVFQRMISERQRIAEKIRSIGKGEKARIEGKTKKDLQTLRSEAYRTVQTIKGEAEAKAIITYARSLGRDPSFYEFTRTLEAYEKTLSPKTKFLLSTDSEFWQVLKKGQ